MDRKLVFFGVAAGLFVIAAGYYGWRWLSAPPRRTPEQLAEIAITAPSPQVREEAAVQLAPLGKPAVRQMKRVLQESQAPEVRAPVIQGLAQEWDFDSMPAFLDALDDESLVVRVRAHGAVQRLLQIDVGYRAEDPPEKRRPFIKLFREEWEKMRVSPGLKRFRDKLEGKGQ